MLAARLRFGILFWASLRFGILFWASLRFGILFWASLRFGIFFWASLRFGILFWASLRFGILFWASLRFGIFSGQAYASGFFSGQAYASGFFSGQAYASPIGSIIAAAIASSALLPPQTTSWKAGKKRSHSLSEISTRSSICSTLAPMAPRNRTPWRKAGDCVVGSEIEMAEPEPLVDRGEKLVNRAAARPRHLHLEGATEMQRAHLALPDEQQPVIAPAPGDLDHHLFVAGAVMRPFIGLHDLFREIDGIGRGDLGLKRQGGHRALLSGRDPRDIVGIPPNHH